MSSSALVRGAVALGQAAAAVCVGITVNDAIFSVSRVEGRSMHPTLKGAGSSTFGDDVVLLDKFRGFHFLPFGWAKRKLPGGCEPGDVVVLDCPERGHRGRRLIKRFVAGPGEWVRLGGRKRGYGYDVRDDEEEESEEGEEGGGRRR